MPASARSRRSNKRQKKKETTAPTVEDIANSETEDDLDEEEAPPTEGGSPQKAPPKAEPVYPFEQQWDRPTAQLNPLQSPFPWFMNRCGGVMFRGDEVVPMRTNRFHFFRFVKRANVVIRAPLLCSGPFQQLFLGLTHVCELVCQFIRVSVGVWGP